MSVQTTLPFKPRKTTCRKSAHISALDRLGAYTVKSERKRSTPFALVFSRGSVVDFFYPPNPSKAAIVNAANEGCLGGGGVDGAIGEAGGDKLYRDRRNLPVISVKTYPSYDGDLDFEDPIRCPTGEAKMTGPDNYGDLRVPYVIHAVGPHYSDFRSCLEEGDKLLRSAYTKSLERAREVKLEAVAFCLLSSGVFRGRRSLKQVLAVGVEAICDFGGYDELKEVHLCAFTAKEGNTLIEIATELGLARSKGENDPDGGRN